MEKTLINFIPESYNIDKIEDFFENFILSKEKNKLRKNLKNKALFDFYFGRLLMLNLVRNEEFNMILDKIRNKYKLKRKDIDIFKEFLKEKAEEYLEQLSETDMLKELLDHIYNIDKLINELEKIMNVIYKKAFSKFQKEKNDEIKDLIEIIGIIYIEKPFHYKSLIQILVEEKKLDKKIVENFEKEILIPFSNSDKMTDKLKIKILNNGKNKAFFIF